MPQMRLEEKQKRLLAEISLLICGAVWGGGFVVTKQVMERIAPSWTLAIRFLIPALLLALYLRKRLIRIDRRVFLVAAGSGVIQFGGLIAQMTGLTMTTAGNSAFLTAIYVVLVPFIQWAFNKKRPAMPVFLAGALCLGGVGLIALQGGFRIYAGDAWELFGGLLFALNIVLISVCITGGMDALVFTCIQFLFTAIPAILLGAIGAPQQQVSVLFEKEIITGLIYIVVVNTIFAQIVHNIALGHANPSHATLIMSTEAPFGCLFGFLFLKEPFTPRFFLGALLICCAILLSELVAKRGGRSAPGRIREAYSDAPGGDNGES